MTPEEFSKLQPGDIVRHRLSSDGYIVHTHLGRSVDVVRIMHMTNPEEWLLIQTTRPGPHAQTAIFYREDEDENRL